MMSSANNTVTTDPPTQAPPTPRPQLPTPAPPVPMLDTDAGKVVITLLVIVILLLLFLATVVFVAYRLYKKVKRLKKLQQAAKKSTTHRTAQTQLSGKNMDEFRSMNGIYMGSYTGKPVSLTYMPSRWHKVHPDWNDPFLRKYPQITTVDQ